MRRLFPLILTQFLVCGCGVTQPVDNRLSDKPDGLVVHSFDSAACAEALAHQADLANESPAFKASEVLDGILTFGIDAGIPPDFTAKVRSVCPAIGAIPAGDISVDQVNAIRAVR